MAKKNVRDEPLKPQVSENEQMSDIVFILDKMELICSFSETCGFGGSSLAFFFAIIFDF